VREALEKQFMDAWTTAIRKLNELDARKLAAGEVREYFQRASTLIGDKISRGQPWWFENSSEVAGLTGNSRAYQIVDDVLFKFDMNSFRYLSAADMYLVRRVIEKIENGPTPQTVANDIRSYMQLARNPPLNPGVRN
jgi:hypothetical protein